MITIVNSKKLIDMLPPLDEEAALIVSINRKHIEFEAWFNKLYLYLGVLAPVYIIIRCYQH